uniref:Uncharacterized protein n=1 Tax=Arundo donax TaxID=35708 RepID=A0A0A9FYN4_ARUDO
MSKFEECLVIFMSMGKCSMLLSIYNFLLRACPCLS